MDKLESSGLSVFFFPRNQEELAGTDGMESMREPFLSARTVVVLYREQWGKTPWTRVEETAIKERCLNHGWSSLMFVSLESTDVLPKSKIMASTSSWARSSFEYRSKGGRSLRRMR